MKNGLTITVTLRKRDTGWKVWSYATDDANGAKTSAQILVDSSTFRNCYAVAVDWQGDIMFECRPGEVGGEFVVPQAVPHVHVPMAAPVVQQLPQPQYGSYGTPGVAPAAPSGYGAPPTPTHGYGAPPAPTGRSYGPAPVPQQVVRPSYPQQQPHVPRSHPQQSYAPQHQHRALPAAPQPQPSTSRGVYGAPPSPGLVSRLLGTGK